MITYPIHELFYTFQGEGSAMGLPAFFVRTFGCPVQCAFCDSAGTWHPDYIPKHVTRMTPEEILHEVEKAGANRVVVTGGEPTIFDLAPLVDVLLEARIESHLETSGAFEIKGDFDWIVVSPKRAKLPLESAVARADEFKFIIEKSSDIAYFTKVLFDRGLSVREDARPIWLHPEWSTRADSEVLKAIVDAVKMGKELYRAGYQIHKLYSADSFDPRSQPLVPLGGDLTKGF